MSELWDLDFETAVAVCEREIAADPARQEWGEAVADLLGGDPIPEGAGLDLAAESAVSGWACPHCGADVGWGCGVCCLLCGKVVVPF
jgi:hypothetical protein